MNVPNITTWPEAFAVLFFLGGIALIFHGFPKIHFGKKEKHYHYEKDDDEDE